MDVTSYYSRYFRPGMIDLSRSGFDAVQLDPDFANVPWDAVRPPGGIAELRAAVASRCYSGLGPDDILLCSGASEALVATVLALGLAGKPVVALPGAYPSFTRALEAVGAVRYSAFDCDVSLVCALATNPDPAGRRLDVDGFIDCALSAGAVPIVDEVHRHAVIDGLPPPAAAADLHPAAVSIDDLSKPLGLGGLRVGWVATRNRKVRRRIERAIQLITGGPSVLADIAALSALERYDEHLQVQRLRVEQNAPAIFRALRDAGWSFSKPELGLTVAALPPAPLDQRALQRVQKAGFFLLPCSALDADGGSSALRISLLADPDCLRQALKLLIAKQIEQT
jgi:aspartate/methionine/tyrosine aminotransferase